MTADEDRTQRVRELFEIPFNQTHGIEVVEATADRSETRLPYDDDLIGNPELPAIHGGVISALADLTGAAPMVAAVDTYTPTIDLRVDYLSHAGKASLHGEAHVRRRGASIGVADIEIRSAGQRCAVAKGVYKLDF